MESPLAILAKLLFLQFDIIVEEKRHALLHMSGYFQRTFQESLFRLIGIAHRQATDEIELLGGIQHEPGQIVDIGAAVRRCAAHTGLLHVVVPVELDPQAADNLCSSSSW